MHKKHFLLLLPALLLLGGCETGDKITAFWADQGKKLMATPYGMMLMLSYAQHAAKTQAQLGALSAAGQPFSPEEMDQQIAKSQEELKRMEALFNPSAAAPDAALPSAQTAPGLNAAPAAGDAVQTPGAQPAAKRPARPRPQQIMEISIEDDSPEFNGRAPVEDQRSMHRSIDFIKTTNQQAVTDVQRLMGTAARDEVILLNTRTEKQLQNASVRAASLQQFNKMQTSILNQYKTDFQNILNKYQKNIKRS